MGRRFLLVFLAVALIAALSVLLLGARWGGFITGGVAGILIVLFLRSKWGTDLTLD